MRLLIATAVVALLVVIWLPSRGAPRASPGAHETATPSGIATSREDSGRAADGGSPPVKEVKGLGEEEEGRPFRITVVSARDGAAIAGAKVLGPKGACMGVTGADGVAEFLEFGYGLRVTAPGFFPKPIWPGHDRHQWLVLLPATSVTGKVVDAATREPIDGAKVAMKAKDAKWSEHASTDAEGAFEIPGAMWQPFKLIVGAEGYVPETVEGTLKGPQHGLEVALEAGGTLEGTVSCADGSPATRTPVELRAGKKPILLLSATTDQQGFYRISGVQLGVEVTPTAGAGFSGQPVVFRAAGELQRRDIRYAENVHLVVSAFTAAGEPVQLGSAELVNDRSRMGRPPVWFTAPPGSYRLSVHTDGWQDQERDVVLTSGRAHEIFVFEEHAIDGAVVAVGGAPVEEATVELRIEGRTSRLGTNGRTRTDAQGRFRIAGLPASPVRLEVSAWPDRADTFVDGVVPGGPPVVVTMTASARITARVPGGAAEVQRQFWPDGWGRSELEPDGRFEYVVTDLSAAPVLGFRRDEDSPPVVFSLPLLTPGEVRDLGEIRLPEGRTVDGRVLEPGKAPVAAAAVALAEPGALDRPPHIARTDGEGRFRLLRMPEGAFSVRVDAEGWPPHFFRIEGGAAELRLSAGGVAELPVAMRIRPAVLHECAGNGAIEIRKDADGRYRVRLQAGEYSAQVKGGGWFDFAVREGETTQVTPR